jgi:hypothetical protein
MYDDFKWFNLLLYGMDGFYSFFSSFISSSSFCHSVFSATRGQILALESETYNLKSLRMRFQSEVFFTNL